MGSPVDIAYQNIIGIDRYAATAVYLQIAQQLVDAIQRGYLIPGAKLPGTRQLSEQLQVHRKTIVAAYEDLDDQGWVETIPNKGTFVLECSEDKIIRQAAGKAQGLAHFPARTGYAFKQSNLLDNPFEYALCKYAFNDGVPDMRLTQATELSHFYSANLKRKSNHQKMGHYNTEGSEYFKEHLSHYLNLSRGLRISKNNLLITRSTEMSIYIIAEILLSPGDLVLVGDPGYFAVNMIFQKSGAVIQTVPVDEEGLRVDFVRAICAQRPVRMLYLTPHHHYPTTVTLSAGRRIALLALAAEYGFVILEDDYDYDFHYDKGGALPLASSDTAGMVIYVGGFGQSLAPGFRTGFAVAPENLMIEMRKHLGIIDRQGDILMEQALGEMIEAGEMHRHLKKSVKIYRERRDAFVRLLNAHLGTRVRFNVPSGGLAVWVSWEIPVNLYQLSAACLKEDLFVPKRLLYQDQKRTAMRLGFGHMHPEEMAAAIKILAMALSAPEQ